MHQPLDGLPHYAIVDTNILLNACFIGDSSARFSIEKISMLGFQLVMDDSIEQEAKSILQKYRIKNALFYNPGVILRNFINTSRIMTLPKASQPPTEHVNRADQHIAAAATQYGCWVITGDIKLAAELTRAKISARLPTDIEMADAISREGKCLLNQIIQFIGLSLDQGSIFARISPGSWSGMADIGKFTVCETENAGKLYYDTYNSSWVFEINKNNKARVRCQIEKSKHWMVCASYEINKDSGKGHATLRTISEHGDSQVSSAEFTGRLDGPGPGKVSFGHSLAGTNYWNGHIRKIVISPKSMTKSLWSALANIPDSSPDPSAGNILEAALRRVRIDGNVVWIPGKEALQTSWI